jgi:hypothetical protein
MTLNEIVDLLLKAAGFIVVAGGGAAVLIIGPFRYLADKWLTSKFDKRLEQFKHAQQVEMENLRFKISTLCLIGPPNCINANSRWSQRHGVYWLNARIKFWRLLQPISSILTSTG